MADVKTTVKTVVATASIFTTMVGGVQPDAKQENLYAKQQLYSQKENIERNTKPQSNTTTSRKK